jgi:hypothetical protein
MTYEQTEVLDNEKDVPVEKNLAEKPMSTADLARGMATNNAPANTSSTGAAHQMPLFADNELGDLRRRWQDVQVGFVDDPRNAVKGADELVASLMTRLAQIFSDERGKLEHEWDKGENVSTEDLRVALQRYRSFFDRLLSV